MSPSVSGLVLESLDFIYITVYLCLCLVNKVDSFIVCQTLNIKPLINTAANVSPYFFSLCLYYCFI